KPRRARRLRWKPRPATCTRKLDPRMRGPAKGRATRTEKAGAAMETGAEGAAEQVVTVVEAIRQALHEEMARDERVMVLGQDVGRKGGVFLATEGLLQRFGPERVLDTPISES